MATYRVTAPDGTKYKVTGPDGATEEEVLAQVKRQSRPKAPSLLSQAKRQIGLTARYIPEGLAEIGGLVANPVNAIINAGLSAAGSKYRQGTDLGGSVRGRLDKVLPKPETGLERVVGDASRAMASAAPMIGAGALASRAASPVTSAVGRMLGQAPGSQAGYAALAGGSAGTAREAGLPPALQVAFGLGIPMAVGGAGMAARKVAPMLRGDRSPQVARDAVASAMRDDAITPEQAAQMMQEANARGVPLSLSDLGDNLRGMTGSLSRKPGLPRTLVRDMVDTRQAAQGDRIRNAIVRDLGDIVNPYTQSDDLMQRAQRAAAPLYDDAYNAAPVASPVLDDLLSRPAGRQALARARTIAANEGRDPTALGFALDADGNVVLNPIQQLGDDAGNLTLTQEPARVRSYSPQTLDYVKRGLDDIIEAQRDPVTRRLHLDEAGRAINGVRADLLRELDRLNPPYAAARQAYAGPASARQALELGRKALNYSDQEIERAVSRLNEGERQQFAVGFRSALADALDRRIDGSDKVGALLGNPRKRRALAQVFGGEEGLQNFLSTMADERAANETYRAVRTGSPTAERIADDQGNLLEQGAQALYNVGRGNTGGLIRQGIGALQDFRRFGAGQAAQRARENAVALLTETDPDAFRRALQEAARQDALRRMIAQQRRVAGPAAAVGTNARQ